MTAIRKVIIVGGSLAGASAAFAIRKTGFDGSVTLIGEERHLPYERPPLSKDYLRGEVGAEKAHVRPEADYQANDIGLLRGRRALSIDPVHRTVALDDERRLAYDRLILTTGSTRRRLPVPKAALPGVLYLRTLDDADAIRSEAEGAAQIVVIGGGWIGSEVAASLRQMGRDVTIVMELSTPLQNVLGPEVGAVYADLHRAHGVELVNGRAAGLLGDQRVRGVQLEDGRTLRADLVVAGVGAVPRAGLGLRAGLALDNGAIAVDERLRTSDPAILAAGDVAAALHPRYGRLRVEHWQNAREQGATAGRNAVGAEEVYGRTPYFYSDQFDLGMEYRGLAMAWDEVVIRGDVASREFIAFWLSGGRVMAAMNANIWDAGKSLATIVEAGASIPADRLADVSVPFADLAA